MRIVLFLTLEKATEFEIVVCCKLWVVLYRLNEIAKPIVYFKNQIHLCFTRGKNKINDHWLNYELFIW